MQEIIRLMGMDMLLELGLNYTMLSMLPAQIRKSFAVRSILKID
jgi:hypothetical protein